MGAGTTPMIKDSGHARSHYADTLVHDASALGWEECHCYCLMLRGWPLHRISAFALAFRNASLLQSHFGQRPQILGTSVWVLKGIGL